ncbi:MAG: DUF1573 domain-containing protein [Candidatus Hydrogenedentes bacterium]|nr:DUF1573 domain-containing protein [Candidatus Hydrogenedentota bacterium]
MPYRNVWKRTCVAVLSLLALSPMLMGAAVAGPKAEFSTYKIEYGTLRQGTITDKVVTISNTGDAPLEIHRVQSSCPCATTDFPEDGTIKTVAPGASFPLTINYDTAEVIGERSGAIIVSTNDTEQPSAVIEMLANIEALVLTRPEGAFLWGMAPRGDEIGKELVIIPGDGSKDIELIEAHMAEPTMTVNAQREPSGDSFRIKVLFSVAPDVPLGPLTNLLTARVRVSGEEAIVSVPVQGEVAGDVLVMPQYIVCAPRLVYEQNQPLSEEGIIVRASRENEPLPEVLGTVAVGPLQCVIHRNVKPEWGNKADRHIIEVRTAPNAPPGAQGGTIYIMTSSKDQPIVTVPVFFRMGSRVLAEPAQVVLEPAGGVVATQRIVLRDATGANLTIKDLKYEQSLMQAAIETATTAGKEQPASIVVSASAVPPVGMMATVVSVATDQPGAERVLIPVLIRTPTVQAR